jgi:hypothetical protein
MAQQFSAGQLAIGAAALAGAYVIAERFGLVTRAEVLLYSYPQTAAQARADLVKLQAYLKQAQASGNTSLASEIRARVQAIQAEFPQGSAAARTSATASPAAPVSSAQARAASKLTGIAVTQVSNTESATATLEALSSKYFIYLDSHPNATAQNSPYLAALHQQAVWLRQAFPSAGPAGGFTRAQLQALGVSV